MPCRAVRILFLDRIPPLSGAWPQSYADFGIYKFWLDIYDLKIKKCHMQPAKLDPVGSPVLVLPVPVY